MSGLYRVFVTANSAVAATGSNQAGAKPLVDDLNVVTSSTASTADGVVLPRWPLNQRVMVVNTTANTVKVYPPTGGKINGKTADAAVSLLATSATEFTSLDGSNWAGAVDTDT